MATALDLKSTTGFADRSTEPCGLCGSSACCCIIDGVDDRSEKSSRGCCGGGGGGVVREGDILARTGEVGQTVDI